MCVNVVQSSKLPICSRLVNDIRRVAILPTKHSQTLVSHSLQHYSTATLLFTRALADEIESWRGQAKNFCRSSRTEYNTNPAFQNPGSATAVYLTSFLFCHPYILFLHYLHEHGIRVLRTGHCNRKLKHSWNGNRKENEGKNVRQGSCNTESLTCGSHPDGLPPE